jgi:hypothetical protein
MVVEKTGWSLEYIASLKMSDLLDYLRVLQGWLSARKSK